MILFKNYSQLDSLQIEQYQKAVAQAFPPIILRSPVIYQYWSKLELYFPDHQIYAFDKNDELIGFMNMVPIFWDQALNKLPQEGWDWLLKKGLEQHENNIKANSLGGLQVIITEDFLGKGFSKLIIAKAKKLIPHFKYSNFIIPIRPIFKHQYPEMKMKEYMTLKKDNKIYDPWIRTHLKGGAKIISVCQRSMQVTGDIRFWEELTNHEIKTSGSYLVPGALNPVKIQIEKNHGEYLEENIWISYKT